MDKLGSGCYKSIEHKIIVKFWLILRPNFFLQLGVLS